MYPPIKHPDRLLRGARLVDRRWGERLRVDVAVTLLCNDVLIAARLLDLSLSGGYVATPARPKTGQYVALEIDFPWQAARELPPIAAVVVRQDDSGIGLEWADLAADPVLAALTLFR
jgi:hypothetical protein